LRDEAITAITLPPSVLTVLPVEELPALRTITVAGEACPSDLVARWAEGRRFFNAYGPTEATVWSTIDRCQTGDTKPSIGRPISNTQIYLLDRHLNPVPIGVTGELHIGGAGLARGYLQRPHVTAMRFIPDPFSDEPGARLYKSGDLARYLPDGRIEFLGRQDDQVKIRGFRIELGEVEAVLSNHPAVRECVVVVRDENSEEKRLIAYVVFGRLTEAINTHELLSYVRTYLPDYMAPAAIVVLDALPLTANGKVNRKALPKPDSLRPELEVSFIAPQTEIEKRVAAMWQEVLQIARIGINDNFFDLGGHSLLMLQINGKIRAAFSIDIPLTDMFQYPTIRSLARRLETCECSPPSFQKVRGRAQRQKEVIHKQRQAAAQRK
jgi:acyl-coenzyme A synthetase/AMP-(fatty) acid ligase/acyl carrier protein